MGLWDYFKPASLDCPHCGAGLGEFQGRPTGSFHYVWQEHIVHPIDQRVDAEWKDPRIGTWVLDEDVAIQGECPRCAHTINAFARVRNQVWSHTDPDGGYDSAIAIESQVFLCGTCNGCFDRMHAARFHACPHCGSINRMPSTSHSSP